jgi:hypothetical protein
MEFGLRGWESKNLYFYYELHDFHHNHFRFSGSFSPDQMLGSSTEDMHSCSPLSTDPGTAEHLMPCGLLPNYFFSDSFTFSDTDSSAEGSVWHTKSETFSRCQTGDMTECGDHFWSGE